MADYSNAFIGLSYGIEAGAQLGSAYMQSEALKAQGQFQQQMAEINQRFANIKADQVVRQGDDQANQLHRRGLQVQGSQRSAAASQGIRVDDGSAADAVDQTRYLSANDQITTRNNAWREAFGIRTQAGFNVTQAKFQTMANNNAANGTLLGGAMQGLATGLKATSFGLKAIRDQRTPERTDLLTVQSRPAAPRENEYFNELFPELSTDQRNA